MDPIEHRQVRHFQNQIHAVHLALADLKVNRALAVASTLSLQARVEAAKSAVSAEQIKAHQLRLGQVRAAATATSAQFDTANLGLQGKQSQLALCYEAWTLRIQSAQQAVEVQRRVLGDRSITKI